MKRKAATSKSPSQFAWWKVAVSLVLLFHLAGVLAPPFYSATRTSEAESPIAAATFQLLEPYINAMFLDHGYAFFAPGPGPSHLVRFRIEFDDGRPPVEQMFPDLERHWPRLLYHRHFMLAEQLHSDYVTPIAPPRPQREPDESASLWQRRLAEWEIDYALWKRGRDRYLTKWQSYEKHLLQRYGGSRVSLIRVEHQLVPPDASLAPIDLRTRESYIDLNEYPPAEPLAPGIAAPLRPPFASPLGPQLQSPMAPLQPTPLTPPLEELP